MTNIEQLRAGQPLLVDTFAAWREAARELLVHDVPPELVTWSTPYAGGDLFSGAPSMAEQPHNLPDPPPPALDAPPRHPPPHIPRSLNRM